MVNITLPAHSYPYPYPYSYRSVMSVPPRSRTEHRIHYLESFISHMAATPEEKLQTVFEFVISFGILILIYQGKASAGIGLPVAGFVMSVDIVRAAKAWRKTRQQMQQQPDESNP